MLARSALVFDDDHHLMLIEQLLQRREDRNVEFKRDTSSASSLAPTRLC